MKNKKLEFKILAITKLFIILALSLSIQTNADTGTNSGGGGNAVDDELVDLLPAWDPMSIAGVDTIIKKIKQEVPSFADEFQKQMKNLRWVMVPRPLEQVPSNVSGITYTTDQVARQIGGEVQIDQGKFDRLSDASKRALVVHEVLLSFFSDQGLEEHKKTRELTRFLMQEAYPDEKNVQQAIYAFADYRAVYPTTTQEIQYKRLMRKYEALKPSYFKASCKTLKGYYIEFNQSNYMYYNDVAASTYRNYEIATEKNLQHKLRGIKPINSKEGVVESFGYVEQPTLNASICLKYGVDFNQKDVETPHVTDVDQQDSNPVK